jgi:hypothetical protein
VDSAGGLVTVRAPEVRFVRGHGLEIAAARELRIAVGDDGSLEVRRPRGVMTSLPVADVTGAVWLDPDRTAQLLRRGPVSAAGLVRRLNRPLHALTGGAAPFTTGGAVVLVGRDGPLLSWVVDETVPWAGDAEERRTTSGAQALVRALGLVLEPADDRAPDLLAVRRARVAPTSVTTRDRAVALVSVVVAGILATIALRGLEEPTATSTIAAAAAVLALVPAVALLARGRRAFLALATTPPPPDGRVVHRPRPSAGAEVQLGPADVVVVDGAAGESWLPGPRKGGVSKALLGPDGVHLHDDRDHLLHAMATADLIPDDSAAEAFGTACAAAGIELVEHRSLPLAAATEPVRLRHTEVPWLLSGWRVGDLGLVASTLLWLVLAVLAPGIAAALGHGALGWVALAGYAGCLATVVWCWLALRRWRRGVVHREAT